MKTSKIFGIAVVCVTALALAAPASATCSPPKTYTSWDFTEAQYFYVDMGTADGAAFVSAYWQPGNAAAASAFIRLCRPIRRVVMSMVRPRKCRSNASPSMSSRRTRPVTSAPGESP